MKHIENVTAIHRPRALRAVKWQWKSNYHLWSILQPTADFILTQPIYLPDLLKGSGHRRPKVARLGRNKNKNTQQAAKLRELSAIGGELENTGFAQ